MNCSRKIKEDLYLTYIKSTLEHAATAWAPYSRQSINKLESVQRRAARFVMHDYYTKLAVYQTCYYVLIGIPWKHTSNI